LDLNQSLTGLSSQIDLAFLIANHNLPTPLYEANSSVDISSYALYDITDNMINLYAISNVQEIRTEIELNNVRNNLSGKYTLLNDITLTSATLDTTEGWLPIGDNSMFGGIFQGNNYKINGLWINRPSTNNIGFFGYIRNAQIKNLGVEINGEVKGDQNVGGIAGYVQNSNIANSYGAGNVSGSYYVGGIAGYIHTSNIANSYSTGNINGSYYIGGIVGQMFTNGNIANSYWAGNVNGSTNIGGIAGYAGNSNIINSYSKGNVNGNQYIGGIVGTVNLNSNVTNSYGTGNVSGDGVAGGQPSFAGGIAGYVTSSALLVRYNVAINPSVIGIGISYVNRIVGGFDSNSISDNFALNTMRVNDNAVSNSNLNGEGKSEADLKTKSTYESLGWGFGDDNANPWKIDENKNNGFPYFYWQE
jgi:hypothetical protein